MIVHGQEHNKRNQELVPLRINLLKKLKFSHTMDTRSLSWGEGGLSSQCGINHPLHLVPRLKKEQSYTSTPPLGLHDLC
jgi:hypothetical protein